MFLEPEPDFLAVRTPGMVVSEQSDSDVFLLLAKESQSAVRVCRTIYDVWWDVAPLLDSPADVFP